MSSLSSEKKSFLAEGPSLGEFIAGEVTPQENPYKRKKGQRYAIPQNEEISAKPSSSISYKISCDWLATLLENSRINNRTIRPTLKTIAAATQ